MSTTLPSTDAVTTLDNYIGGSWVAAGAGESLDDVNPASGEVMARVPLSGPAEIEAAAAAARAAFPGWRATSPVARARVLMSIRDTLAAHRGEIAELVTLDMGKTIDDADAEIGRGIESVEAAIAMPHLMKGENLEGVARGLDVEMVRQPVGVVAAITPFNFPAMIPLWFLPFAIGAGNTFILKPSEQDPRPSQRIVELIAAIEEIPAGVVNLVHGGREAVGALLDHPEIDAVSFVGSAATARTVASRAVATGKRVQALGGAKNSVVVMPDADPKLMGSGVIGSAFGAAGQRCLAGSVAILVGTGEEQDRSLEVIVDAARKLRVGAGSAPDTDVCPLISVSARERVEAEIEGAVEAGGRLALDGRMDGGDGGAELGPTVIDGLDDQARALREELFGPVLTIKRVPDLAAAVAWSNESRYGNSAILYTESGGAAREFRYSIQAGMVGVNVGVAAPIAWFPFAGWKDSIDGDLHANGRDALEFYTRKKVVTSRWAGLR